MRSFILPLVSIAALVLGQDLDLDLADSLPNAVVVVVPSNLTAQVVQYNTTDAIASAADSALDDSAVVVLNATASLQNTTAPSAAIEKRSATSCAVQPTGYGPVPSPDTASAFLAYPAFSSAALAAPTPSGYIQTYRSLNASSNAYGYLGYYAQSSYDVNACAAKCDSVFNCAAFNVYFERDPALDPSSSSGACPNPNSTTFIKCVLWGGPVTRVNALNTGQWRSQFEIVIAGSVGYVNQTIEPASGYSGPSYYGEASINAVNSCNGETSVIATKVFTGQPFDANLCAAVCNQQDTCVYFNTFLLARNDGDLGQYCRTYNSIQPASAATYQGATSGSYVYTVSHSYGFSSTSAGASGLVLA